MDNVESVLVVDEEDNLSIAKLTAVHIVWVFGDCLLLIFIADLVLGARLLM